ncbi:phage tail protein [Salmonella enterica subsp. enterica serovar Typhimurium]|uniref:phage tail protein n=1 Tax=Escherichia coli TaxID=562 RepID=UPI0011F20686|nr:phage tail protein [Escherichia coli]EAP9918985.1 phage tail protein [Salmonella enterica]EDA7897967.1 phage tail protein [Salmonella enterica subsp. enterica serovar Typhimurium]EDA9141525.1 phage tail protein [Salmonella enterica subsp. enterica serovar Typhimurium]EDL1388737.1 phage tail protein [Salmonella enterica subsp. enterica serovar Typhimurium]MDM5002918.1 phage tail protein [Escherichia coli]
MPDFLKNQDGRYITDGLSSKDFTRLFELIRKEQTRKRRQAHRTLTPGRLRNKSAEDILKLGKKKGGTFFTRDDLKGFEKLRSKTREKYDSKTAGITYAQLVASSQAIDIKRANNAVDDGSGIKRATPVSLRHNVINIRVEASDISVHQHHIVRIRFEEWDQMVDDIAEDDKSALKITKSLCAGRVSFDCDCGRHQYWYRYIATAGNFALAPPKEYAYPKVRNPKLQGVACKHVIHSMTRLQSASWQMSIARALQKAATQIAFGDDRRRTTKHFSKEDEREFNRNRNSKTNVDAAKREWRLYQKRQAALSTKLAKDNGKIDKLRDQLTKARKLSDAQKKRAAAKEAALQREKQKNKELQQRLADQFALKKQAFIDALVMAGTSPEQAEKMFMEYVKKGS